MLIDYKSSLAYICPVCSLISVKDVNIFDLSGKTPFEIFCSDKSCREKSVSIRKKGSKYIIDAECPVCGENHSFTLSAEKFWSTDLIKFACPVSLIDILFIGEKDKITNAVNDENSQLSDFISEAEEDFDEDYLCDILENLFFLQEEHSILCMCGSSDTEILPLPEGIAVMCKKCGKMKILPPTVETLTKLENIDTLFIDNRK